MTDFPFDIVLFDLDGTLVDSNLDLGPAINHGLSLAGRPALPLEATRKLIGGGAAQMLKKGLEETGGAISDAAFEKLVQDTLAYYWDHIADNTVAFDGCVTALEALTQRGVTLGVCTNKVQGPARQLLDQLDMSRHFTAIYGADTLGRDRAKPHPDMLLAAAKDCGGGRVAMIGDSTYDTRAAKAAGAPVVACSFGYLDAPVEELGADAIIDHFDELIPVLEKL